MIFGQNTIMYMKYNHHNLKRILFILVNILWQDGQIGKVLSYHKLDIYVTIPKAQICTYLATFQENTVVVDTSKI